MVDQGHQVLVRCGGEVGTVGVIYLPQDTISSLKDRLVSGSARPASAQTSLLRLVHAGRVCPEDAQLASLGVLPGSLLDLSVRLRGGGGDGGSTGAESRASYLEMYATKKKEKANPEEEKLAKWTTCRLSGERLQPPVCADELGNLYNKGAVVTGLVAKSLPPSMAHITSLRHLLDLKLERNPSRVRAFKDFLKEASRDNGASAGNFNTNNDVDFACPLTGLPMNGRYRFVASKKTGHVISEKAIKEVPAAVEELVGGKWEQEDVLPLNGTPEEVRQLRDMMLLQRAAAKAKKGKKKIGTAEVAADGSGAAVVGSSSGNGNGNAAGAAVDRKRSAIDSHAPRDQKAQAKKCKVSDIAPKKASQEVWASIFTSSRPEEKETYSCRALTSRGWV